VKRFYLWGVNLSRYGIRNESQESGLINIWKTHLFLSSWFYLRISSVPSLLVF
jgi:hypothetical protein